MVVTMPSKIAFRLLLWGLIAVLFLMNLFSAFYRGMDRVSPWLISDLSVAISEVYFGHPADYAGYSDVDSVYMKALSENSDQASAFKQVLKIDPLQIDRQKEMGIVSADDKGIIDFFRLSLKVFGLHTYSFVLMYFLIIACSSLAFVLAF
jgi:hypothetical protein